MVRVRAGRLVNTGETRKQKQSVDRSRRKNAHRQDETKRTGNRQTEYTGIKTQGIMGDTWRGVETSTKTGEADQGMTAIETDWTLDIGL